MRINLGTKVMTADGHEIGKIDQLVVDPRTDEMQEFVVRKGFFTQHDVIIPIGQVEDRVGNDDDDTIHLSISSAEVDKLPEFVQASYATPPVGMYPGVFGDSALGTGASNGGLLWPGSVYEPANEGSLGRAGLSASSSGEGQTQNVAPGMMSDSLQEARPQSVFLTTGTDVEALDGKVGTVDELVVDPQRGKVTEIIVKQGLFGGKEIRIPTQFIEEIDGDAVHIALDKARLEKFTIDR
jgi:sporulation protein YlmC with PRC-barrel domain